MYQHFFKRLIDFFAALLGLLLLSPIFLIVMIALAIANRDTEDERSRIFFFQERPGKGEKIFKIVKFLLTNSKKEAITF